jgi:hypothetical protein
LRVPANVTVFLGAVNERIRPEAVSRKASLALARELLCAPEPAPAPNDDEDASIKAPTFVCQHCGRALLIVQTFTRGQAIRGQAIRAPPQEPAS